MAFNIIVTGMVLSAIPIGDYDKRITLLTRERGKIAAFVRGARRSGNQMMAAANPFAFGRFEVYEGKSTYTAVRADIENYFRELANDYDQVCLGYYFLEAAQYYAQENMDETERLKLLYQTLRALESRKFTNRLIRAVYDLKTMAINGEYPNVFSCLRCGKKEELSYFSMKMQGCVCVDCYREAGGAPISPAVLYAMQYIISAPIQKLYTFVLAPEAEQELAELLAAYRKHYEPHRFQSEEFLD